MENQLILPRSIVLALAFVFLFGIPGYLIANNYIDREGFTYLGKVFSEESNTVEPKSTSLPTATRTPRPSATPSPTRTPIFTRSPTNLASPGFDFSGAYVTEVVHIDDDGEQSMVKIAVPRVIVGEFHAEVKILWTTWAFNCLLIDESEDHLFCVGPRLPPSDQAVIQIFEVLLGGEESVLVFETEFEVFRYIPNTSTPSKPKPPPTITLTPTNTPTPTQTYTPLPPTSTIPPWVTPPTPSG